MTIARYGPPWVHVGRSAAALAASMGIGRFVYTPILPLMTAQVGLSTQGGAALATSNYVGYLVGALAGALPVFRRPVVARVRHQAQPPAPDCDSGGATALLRVLLIVLLAQTCAPSSPGILIMSGRQGPLRTAADIPQRNPW